MLWTLQVEGDIREGRLEANSRGNVNIKHELLKRLLYFFVGKLIVRNKWREQCIEVTKRLYTSRLST